MNTSNRTPDAGARAKGDDAAEPREAESNEHRLQQQLGPDAGRATLRRRLADLIARGPLPCEPAEAWTDAPSIGRKSQGRTGT